MRLSVIGCKSHLLLDKGRSLPCTHVISEAMRQNCTLRLRTDYTVRVFSTARKYREYCTMGGWGVGRVACVPWEDILEPWGMFSTEEDIMSILWGCSVLWVCNLLLLEYLHGTEHPHDYHDIPHGTQITKDIMNFPHGTEHPPRY